MQTYLKTKPAWAQLLLFLSMAFGIFMVVFLLGGMVLSQLTGISVMEMSNQAQWDATNPKTLFMIRGMLLLQFLGLFVLPSLLFAYFSDPEPGRYLGLQQHSKALYWVLGIAVLLVAVPLVEYTGLLNRQILVGTSTYKWMERMEQDAMRTIQLLLGGQSVSNLVLNLIFIAVFAGIGEELFFRGILQRILIKAFKSPWAGIIIAAFAFSFFHFQFFGFIPRFLLGILLGATYWYSGSLWPAIVAHIAYDALFITIAYFNPHLVQNPEATLIDKSSGLTVMALISAALVGGTVWLMKKRSTTSYAAVYADDNPKTHEEDLSY